MTRAGRWTAVLAVALAAAGCTPSGTVAPSPTPTASPTTESGAAGVAGEAALAPERVVDGGATLRPGRAASEPRFRAALVADHCIDRDLPAPASVDPALTVLDRSYALAPTYAPSDLVPASSAGLDGESGTKLVREVVVADLSAMHAAWESAGLVITVTSGYRSYAAQAATFDAWVARLGFDAALVRSARPGHSEHQLGTAIDVSSPGWDGRFGDWAAETPEGRWMAEHAWEYGFVMSYPAGSQAVTCFSYEPWHYRWIGRDAAAAHRASGVTLREYLASASGG